MGSLEIHNFPDEAQEFSAQHVETDFKKRVVGEECCPKFLGRIQSTGNAMSRNPYYGKKISVHLAATLVVAGLVLAACESGEETGRAVQGDLPQGGHLIMAWDASHEPASLDGHIEPYQPAWLIDSFIADPLLILGPDGEFHPALASSWTSSANADRWTFHLRDDVTFQDGTPFNAQALEYNLRRILDPETRSAEMAARLGPVEKIEIVDDYTLTLHYSEPWVVLLDGFWRMPIWSPTAAEKWGPEEFDKHLVGAGPFTLEEWLPNSHVTLEKWDGYGGWNSISEEGGTARLSRVTINFIGEEAVLGSVVQTGDAHIAMNLPAAYIDDYVDTCLLYTSDAADDVSTV
mgnify:CR=1 FL=1